MASLNGAEVMCSVSVYRRSYALVVTGSDQSSIYDGSSMAVEGNPTFSQTIRCFKSYLNCKLLIEISPTPTELTPKCLPPNTKATPLKLP